MPTIQYYRTWCKTCQDWTCHLTPFMPADGDKTQFCRDCKTKYTDIKESEIPPLKIREQRARYTASRSRNPFGIYKTLMAKESILSEKWPEPEITECDAGQAEIDYNERIAYNKALAEKEKEQHILKEESLKFINLKRNDTCACGSAKKYKKCCMAKFINC